MTEAPERRGPSRRREDHERDRLFELSQDLLGVAGLNGIFRQVNPSWERTSGWPSEILCQRPLIDFLHNEDFGLVEMAMTRIKGGSAMTFEARLMTRDNRPVWMQFSATPDLPNEAIYVTAQNIAMRKMAESESARYAAVVKSSNDAIFSATMHGVIDSWNPAAERIFGYKASEAVGKPVTMLLPRASQVQPRASQSAVDKGDLSEPVIFEQAQRKRKDGMLVTVSLTISPVKDASGKVVATSFSAREVGRDVVTSPVPPGSLTQG